MGLDEESYNELVDLCERIGVLWSYIGLIFIAKDIPINYLNEFYDIINKYNLNTDQEIIERSSGNIYDTVFGINLGSVFDRRLWPILFLLRSHGGAGTVGGITGQEYLTIYGPLSGDQILQFTDLAKELGVAIITTGEDERWYMQVGPMTTQQKVQFQKLADSMNVSYDNNPSGQVPPVINPDQSTKYTRAEFIELVAPYCEYKGKQVGILPSLAIAQAVVESGNGNSGLTAVSNNLFGYKGSYQGQSVMYPTWDYLDGQWIYQDQPFRKYPNWNASLDDYFSLLTTANRYKNLVWLDDYKLACRYILEDGYAGAPQYTSTLINVIETNNLTKYDVGFGK